MSSDSSSQRPPANELTAEELILQMEVEEVQELLGDMGFDPRPEFARGIQQLVASLGSLDAAIVALQDNLVQRRAA
ncbi:hypothetical protein [Rhodopirellula bahusiensis]|uniref:Uncharacterized protein n=1 Tax=Rhodopirellula bahusiensis TaxID=2014065 RepID=A0A2G1VXI1_9BACT|nr:hypothetical protein [Rhodopirellula bahusiensis]PHQ31455.1 hypothetical protein CEE69_31120 [Rhodopirellula bahusiensis]